MKSLKKILIMPDTHVPYEDKKAVSLFYNVMQAYKPDIFVSLGDFADFYSVSSFSKRPDRLHQLDEELSAVNVHLDYIDSVLPRARKIFLAGNHEYRLERYLTDKAPELFNMIKVEKLFQFDKRKNWEYVPYKDHIRVGKVYLTHDTGQCGMNAHRSARNVFNKTCLIGHTHRLSYEIKNSALGIPHLAAMFGWLGDFKEIDYMHRVAARTCWSHGFGYGLIDEKSHRFYLVPTPIVQGPGRRYSCMVDGKIYEV